MRTLVAMRDVYVSHPAAPTVKTVPIDFSAHARVNQFVNRRKFVVFEMFYSYLTTNGEVLKCNKKIFNVQ